ncbi:M48 family metalloprotease [Flavitalea sp. BT771]|uniref:M48 family metalloprotease n=1 Tax=Flavitalea sp. BT771 TaxID=3063329 RepID=UPI0026E316A2|nr:M48 family metalloprotease [Flavitalea sp. BT771]MDO6429269.1 M48 family metalloprotease [Flavitalea sp. BT771]MDV6218603.1 M48 family metalloprotease [Flavitalea sp. BT771]
MNKTFQITLVALYVSLTGFCFLLSLAISGVYISWQTFAAAMAGWLLFCFLSVYFLGPVHLYFHGRLRQPVMEEEARLRDCFAEVLQRAGCVKKFRLRMAEVEGEEAFACNNNVIAVSKALLDRLTDEELKGVLAHELGHLMSKDTMVSWAFVTASDLPALVRRVFAILRPIIRRLLALTLITLVILFLFKPMLLMPVIAMALFLLTFSLLDRLFRWLRLVLSRQCEYKQDVYAHRLGYGAGLRDALKKLAQYGREQVNAYFILMNGTHPVIYQRIRRLEKLEGMRG